MVLDRLIVHDTTDPPRSDRHHTEAVARRSSFARLALAVFVLVTVSLDPLQGLRFPYLFDILLAIFALYGAAVVAAAAARPVLVFRAGPLLHLSDLAWTVAVTAITDGVNSPFVTFFFFGMLAAGYRWGLVATLYTTAIAMVVVTAEGVISHVWLLGSYVHLSTVILRTVYLGAGGVLIGLLADEEHRQRRQSLAVAWILGRVRLESGLLASVKALFNALLAEFGGTRGLLTLEEEGSSRVFLWSAEAQEHEGLRVRLTDEPSAACATYMFPLPPAADVLRIGRAAGPGHEPSVVALDTDGRRQRSAGASARPLLDSPFPWQTALCLSRVSGQGWAGRLFVFDPRAGRDSQLRFLQVVVRQVAPALLNLYLQRRLQSRTGALDRARVARELHDGVIQSLIGLQMELEVLRRESEGLVTGAIRTRFEAIQRTLADEILDVRDLMQTLRPVEMAPDRLIEHLAETIERFRHRTGITARLFCDMDHVDLSPARCRELAAIVQEALANVRKHSGASNVLVRLATAGDGWQLVIDDDGRGFDFEGRLTEDELDRRRRGPVMIKERVRAIGGRLAIGSEPGHGSRLEITIPRQGHHDSAPDPHRHRGRSPDLQGGPAATARDGA